MDISKNILEWYPFEEEADVLEIYKETSILEKVDKKINLKKLELEELKELNGQNSRLEGKYDYITLIGTYEYAPTIFEGEKPYSTFLKVLKNHLKPNGKILLAIDNRLGIKYYTGAKSKHYERIFEGIESEVRKAKPNLLIKREIEKYIKEAEFENYKFYYPLSDYNNANSIFTDEFIPKSNHSKILYPVNYEEGSIVVYNEVNAMKQICDNGKFAEFTNSYLIEISNEKIDNGIKFVNYNVFRKDKYKLMLIMKNDIVEKYAANKEAKAHIRNIEKYIKGLQELGFNVVDKVENDEIISKVINSEELDKKIVEEIKDGNFDKAYEEIENWYSYIKEKLEKKQAKGKNIFEKCKIEVPEEIKENMHFVEDGYIDLSFENVFCEEEGYLFYDQEWYFENIPLEFILYRAINNLYTYNESKIEPRIKKEDMLGRFNLNQFAPYFDELEKHIQKEILDEVAIKEYREKIKGYFKNLEQLNDVYLNIKQENEKLKQDINKINEEKNVLEENYNKLVQEYNTSRGWKMIKKFRKICGKK